MDSNCVSYYQTEYRWRTRDDLWNPFTKFLVDSRAKLASFVNGRVLDIGCGDGYISVRMLEKGNEIYGVDLGFDLLKYAFAKGIKAVLCDALNLCFTKDSFDTVILLETLEHLSAPEVCLREIHYVLRHNGQLILSVPAKSGIIVQLLEFKSKLRKKSAPIHHLYRLNEIQNLIMSCSYGIIRARRFAFYNNIFVIAKKV